MHYGALLVWTVIASWLSWSVPGASYLFVWPLPLMIVATMVRNRGSITRHAALWAATLIGAVVVVPITALVCAVLVGVVGPGGIAIGALVSLLIVLMLPQLDAIAAIGRGRVCTVAAIASVLALVAGLATVRANAAHPAPSMLTYAMDADSGDRRQSGRSRSLRRQTPDSSSGSACPLARTPRWNCRRSGRACRACRVSRFQRGRVG